MLVAYLFLYIFKPTIAIAATAPIIPTTMNVVVGDSSELDGGEGVGDEGRVGEGYTVGEGDDVGDGAGDGDAVGD